MFCAALMWCPKNYFLTGKIHINSIKSNNLGKRQKCRCSTCFVELDLDLIEKLSIRIFPGMYIVPQQGRDKISNIKLQSVSAYLDSNSNLHWMMCI